MKEKLNSFKNLKSERDRFLTSYDLIVRHFFSFIKREEELLKIFLSKYENSVE
jgi:hypothetical protein